MADASETSTLVLVGHTWGKSLRCPSSTPSGRIPNVVINLLITARMFVYIGETLGMKWTSLGCPNKIFSSIFWLAYPKMFFPEYDRRAFEAS